MKPRLIRGKVLTIRSVQINTDSVDLQTMESLTPIKMETGKFTTVKFVLDNVEHEFTFQGIYMGDNLLNKIKEEMGIEDGIERAFKRLK